MTESDKTAVKDATLADAGAEADKPRDLLEAKLDSLPKSPGW